jgi:hypothetical protein
VESQAVSNGLKTGLKVLHLALSATMNTPMLKPWLSMMRNRVLTAKSPNTRNTITALMMARKDANVDGTN